MSSSVSDAGSSKACPKCNSLMDIGFMADQSDGFLTRVATWVAGEPEKSFWSGVKISDAVKYPVLTYRCVRCGFLENYADMRVKA